MKMGGCNVLITNPRDIPGFVKELAKHKFTIITGVNTLFNALLNNPDFHKLDFSHLKMSDRRRHGGAEGGGRPLEAGHRQGAARGLRPHRDLAGGDASTRSSLTEYNGSIGLPLPSTEIEIRDDAGKDLAARRQAARSASRGPQVMKGYWQRPEETAKVIDARRLLRHRRHRRHGRAGLHPHRRPQEGHDPGVGLQRVPERDRGGGRDAPGRARVRGDRRARRRSRARR